MTVTDVDFEQFQKGVPLFKRSDDSSQHKKMLKAKMQMISRLQFFGGIASLTELYPTDELEMFAGDYRFFYYNPDYYRDINLEKAQGDMLHALMHVVLKHFERMKSRVPEVWGLATEIVTDLIVDDTVKTHARFNDSSDFTFEPIIVDVSSFP